MIKFLINSLIRAVVFLSWIFFNFKIYGWYKPFVGEYSELLPDLTFWNIFAISMVITALTGVMQLRITDALYSFKLKHKANNIITILTHVHKTPKIEQEDPIFESVIALLLPWIMLFSFWLLGKAIF